MVVDLLSRLELPEKGCELPIDDYFKGEQLLQVQALASWYVDYVNYLPAEEKVFLRHQALLLGRTFAIQEMWRWIDQEVSAKR